MTQQVYQIYDFWLQTIQQHTEYQLIGLKDKYQYLSHYGIRRNHGLFDSKRYDSAIKLLRNNQSKIS